MYNTRKDFKHVNRSDIRGGVMAYIMVAILLMGLLVLTITAGTEKSAVTSQLDSLQNLMYTDIKLADSAVQECTLLYDDAVDVDSSGTIDASDNPNVPYPVYGDTSSGGTTGDALIDIKCPGAPGIPDIFANKAGRGFRVIDSSDYTATYINNATEGAYIRIARNSASAVWSEVMTRLDDRFSECQAADDTGASPCDNGCFYYWFVRQASSTIATSGDESSCP